jgi:hypothetical protein
MGGKNEDFIESPAKKPKKGDAAAGETVGKIRFHDPEDGTFHFHDATDRLIKVAIPVAEYYVRYNKLRHGDQCPPFIDVANKTMLTMASGVDGSSDPPTFECVYTVSAIQFGATFQKLEKFTPPKR